MIRVKRIKKPSVLKKNAAIWKNQIRSARTCSARKKAQDNYKHDDIKDALLIMFSEKCAYCENLLTHIDYGHIEHFKPKSTPAYFELAVEWNNLFLACGRCNGRENKGTKFPLANKGGPIVNPVKENPSRHLRFDFDPKLKLANVLGASKRGETTRKLLGLNRPKLLAHRSKFVLKLWFIAKRYHIDATAREIIDAATRKNEEYCAFARALKRNLPP